MGRGDNSMVKGDTRVKRTQFWKDTEKTVTKESKKETRYYPAEDVKSKLRNNHNNSRQTKLRASITPGTVLILLAGHFKGKRVVFLRWNRVFSSSPGRTRSTACRFAASPSRTSSPPRRLSTCPRSLCPLR